MNNPPKPPKRIRAIQSSSPPFIYYSPDNKPINDLALGDTEHFYTLEEEEPKKPPHAFYKGKPLYINDKEEEPMEPKEMTAQDAWIAMAKGECVGTSYVPHRIWNNRLQYWDSKNWKGTEALDSGPYSIVPDPSKPEEKKVDEYENDMKRIYEIATEFFTSEHDGNQLRPSQLIKIMTKFMAETFQRKGEK